jgi:hypothetical protein
MERAIDAAMLTVPVEGHYEAGEHCHFCPVIVTCEHFAKRMIDLTAAELEQIEQSAELPEALHAKLVERWKAKGLVNRYYTLLEERLMAELRKGTEIPELKIVHSLGHRKWTLDDSGMMARFRNQGLKKADFVVQSLISPAQAEKILKGKSNFFEIYTTRSTTEKLALAGDKRPAVDPSKDLEVLDVEFTPEAPSAPRASTSSSSSPASSPMMALIDLGESEELETFDELDLDERDELETLGDFGELVTIDLGEEQDTEETEETEEIEL